MGKAKKKKKTVKRAAELTDDSTPRSFIFHRGEVGKTILQLITDVRHLLEPYTATNLKVNKNNILRDFVNVAGPYGISHFIIFSSTEKSPYMKLIRLPRGPTLTFRLDEYSLMKDVTAVLKRPKTIGAQFKFPPLAVLNNFKSESSEVKLMTTVFQNMFPAIKVQKIKLGEIRRCAMFNYDSETGAVDFRHYNIEAVPVGVSRSVKKLLKSKIPNLGSLNDISDFVTGAAYLSESEGEDPADSQVTLPQRVPGRGNIKAGQSAIRLTEMGPRLKLMLIKIQEGVNSGEVLYHKFVEKTVKQKKELKKKKEQARKLKEQRRREQEENIARKGKEKEENKKRSIAGMKRKGGDENDNEEDKEIEKDDASDVEDDVSDGEDDDVEYYRQEVGEEPDDDLVKSLPKKRKFSQTNRRPFKKRDTKYNKDKDRGTKKSFKENIKSSKKNEKLHKSKTAGKLFKKSSNIKLKRKTGAKGDRKSVV